MNKQDTASKTTRYCVQWDSHARHMCTVFCSLMEHQSLVDIAICCGNNTIHAHKCVLAANSPYFREQLEKNGSVEQIVINGLDFTVVKSIVEFMYCGETNILNENLRYVVAAAKLFQMRGLQALVSDRNDVQNESAAIEIPSPLFITKKPKYTNSMRQFNPQMTAAAVPSSYKLYKNSPANDPYLYKKVKRKTVKTEAEKACAKEAAASRLALEALQKELATTPRLNTFVIDETCAETTVENFIPHPADSGSIFETLTNIPVAPVPMVNFPGINDCGNSINCDVSDKIKNILGGGDLNGGGGNVEIMFRTSDGNFVGVTDDLIQNLSGGGGTLQYQIIDEHGQLGEVREIQIQGTTGETGSLPKDFGLDTAMNNDHVYDDSVSSFVHDNSPFFNKDVLMDEDAVEDMSLMKKQKQEGLCCSTSVAIESVNRLGDDDDVLPFREIFETNPSSTSDRTLDNMIADNCAKNDVIVPLL